MENNLEQQSKNSFIVKLYPVEHLQFLLTTGPDLISTQIKKGQYWDQLILVLSEHFLKDIDHPIFIDIGANLGAISIPIAKHIQPRQGVVHSFEAQRAVFYQLCGNIFANHLTQTCHAHHLAIGNKQGTIQVPILDLHTDINVGALSLDAEIRAEQSEHHFAHHHDKKYESVDLQKIDHLTLPSADLIKIDVEGMELDVIKGAKKWLKYSNYPPIFLEVWGDYMKKQKTKKEKLIKYLTTDLGYELFFIDELCIAQHVTRKKYNIILNDQDRQVYLEKLA
ncbi:MULTISPECIES: FkbM family methyltransferase [unclassified Acinetobacter]|uniref:FkbM family methyltransferase n=1 Tax=unclassified Acinetobacter TaxID=196816 RepID=UPI0025777BEE|nr:MULTISPECIES: FkbM family methyltransferase [unclassified Acinetobacter]MDM1758671.1 FkbM family methyltransferase [Acinetobacter sp. 256-1]MDM1762362.1 FkbM family methyltransferase [Acinetobacter sp. 251-1]